MPPLCPPPLADQLVQCWNYDPDNRPTFDTLLKVIKDLLVFKEELQARVCCRYDPSLLSYGTSRDTMRTIAMTLSNSQATTIPCPQRYLDIYRVYRPGQPNWEFRLWIYQSVGI